MELLRELLISHRRCGYHVRIALVLAALPLLLSGMMLYAQRGRGAPEIWLITGSSIAHLMMLWGAYRLHAVTLRRSAWGTWLVQRSDRWFPYFQIGIHGGVAAGFVLLFWFTLRELGLPGTAAQDVMLVALLLQWPIRRGLRFWLRWSESITGRNVLAFLGYFHWIQVTLFAGLTLTRSMAPAGQHQSGSLPLMGLLIWVPVVLAILVMIVLFLDQVTRKTAAAQSDLPPDRID